MKKINFKDKKYVLPLLALPFLLLFIYVGAQFTKEDTKKDQPKELSTSFGETRDSIMTKNDAYDAFFKNGDNRSMLEGLDKEHDSLMSYQDQISIDQKRRIDSLKAVSSRQNQIPVKGKPSSYYNPKNEDKDYNRSADIIRMLNDKSYGKPENEYASESPKENTKCSARPGKISERTDASDGFIGKIERSRIPEQVIGRTETESQQGKN